MGDHKPPLSSNLNLNRDYTLPAFQPLDTQLHV
jgi:hypothetical protein